MKALKIAIIALVIAAKTNPAMAQQLCLQTTVNKRTFNVTSKSVVAAKCPKGYTAIADTSNFRGPKGDPGEAAPSLGAGDLSSLKTIAAGPLSCPGSSTLELYTVPLGKSFILRQAAGHSLYYNQIGEALNGIITPKIQSDSFSTGTRRFSYNSNLGVPFRGGSTVTVQCRGNDNYQYYQLDGFLVADSAQIGPGGPGGPSRAQDIRTLDAGDSAQCPTNGLINIFTVPADKSYVMREATAWINNGGSIDFIETSVNGSIDVKVSGFFQSGNRLTYSTPFGVKFGGDSQITIRCSPQGFYVGYHVDGYLTDPS